MDALERDDCAIRYFERLVELAPAQREIMGDGLFRLSELYRRQGDEERSKVLLRKYWELGEGYGSARLLPYSARFFPHTVSTLYSIEVARFQNSTLYKKLSPDARDTLLTCDPQRREELRAAAEARREEKRAAERAKLSEEERKQVEAKEKRQEAERKKADEKRRPSIYEDGMCSVVRHLGLHSLGDLERLTGARSHRAAQYSVAALEFEDLDTLIEKATAEGKLLPRGPEHWSMADFEYEGESRPPPSPRQARADARARVPGPRGPGSCQGQEEDSLGRALRVDRRRPGAVSFFSSLRGKLYSKRKTRWVPSAVSCPIPMVS